MPFMIKVSVVLSWSQIWYISTDVHNTDVSICGFHGMWTFSNIGLYFILLVYVSLLYCNGIIF